MKTSKPISTISYNTPDFLKNKLDLLCEDGFISEYFFIEHIGEYGDKDHIHLYVVPCKSIDTSKFRDNFIEPSALWYEPNLGCMVFTKSDFDNWFLYSLHDERYLQLKHEVKYEHYNIDDIVTNSLFNLSRLYKDAIEHICVTDNIRILDSLECGFSPTSLIRQGYSPQVVGQIYHLCQSEGMYLNAIKTTILSNERLSVDVQSLITENYNLKQNEKFVNDFLTNFQLSDTLLSEVTNNNS